MPTLTPAELDKLRYEEAFENIARLNSCKVHRFPAVDVTGQHKSVCFNCGGMMHALEVRQYILGYAAAGGNPNDILQGW